MKAEPLKASHISALALGRKYESLRWLQIMLGKSFLANLENTFSFLLPARNPTCLTILEGDEIIGFTILKPKNRKGSCWEIGEPMLIKTQNKVTHKELIKEVFATALDLVNERSQSWITKTNVSNSDLISAVRELGFQPLKSIKSWKFNDKKNNNKNVYNQKLKLKLPEEFEWQPIKRSNVQALWPLEKGSQSPYLRQILDRSWIDLLDQSQKSCGMIINNKNKVVAIIGLIANNNPINYEEFEILTSNLADSRVVRLMPYLLKYINAKYPNIVIECNSEINYLNDILVNNNWTISDEKLLLGRSLWKRQNNKSFIKGAKSLESMIKSLNPQSPPLPTPVQGRDLNNV